VISFPFGVDCFFGRQQEGNYPMPRLGRVHATVRQAILNPRLLRQTRKALTMWDSC